MSEPQKLLDLTNPEFVGELTPEQIQEAGKPKKYKTDSYYYGLITVDKEMPFSYSKAFHKNGERNPEAGASIWLNFTVAPLRPDGSQGLKLPAARYQKQFLYARLSLKAMEMEGYSPEQIAYVAAQGMPNTFDGMKQFLQAHFPDEFLKEMPKWDDSIKSHLFNGQKLDRNQVQKIYDGERDKVIAIQKKVQLNPSILNGKKAFWQWYYAEKDSRSPELGLSDFPSVKFPTATPPKDYKTGSMIPVYDPDKDFA